MIEAEIALALRRRIPGRPHKEDSMTAQSIRRLAERYRQVTGDLGKRADELVDRLDKVHALGDHAMADHSTVLDDMERSIREVEDLTNQLTNAGPPLDDGSLPPKPDINGVTAKPASPPTQPDANGVVVNK